jgi:hypothetical protein
MTKRNIHYFHVLCDGETLRELTEKAYLNLLSDERLLLGWIDDDTFFLRGRHAEKRDAL